PLQRELAFHAKRTVLERSVLRDCTAHALRQLALAMRYQVCHALDVVYEPGYPAAHLYIVRSGRLQANDAEQPVAAAADVPAGRRHPPHEPRTFGPGDHFGEDCISGRLAAQALPANTRPAPASTEPMPLACGSARVAGAAR
ncbi:MAG: cyclic nucleotide-binding domain-containing protein, partial [Hydrogenophaga sp.]